MKSKNFKKFVVGSLLAFMLIGGIVEAEGYWGYALPRWQGNNYTYVHSKKTNAKYITNKVTDLSNTGRVTFWVTDANKKQISDDVIQTLGERRDIYFHPNYGYRGARIRMGMENTNWYKIESAFVSGDVDFK